MTKKIRLTRTTVYEYEANPENYPHATVSDTHEMLAADKRDIESGRFGPEELGDDDPKTIDNWEIFDDNT